MLHAANVGNVNTRYLRGTEYVLEPSMVAPAMDQGFQFAGEPLKALRYLSGPALSRPRGAQAMPAFYVGRDAQRAGVHNLSVVGSAASRITSPAYLLLHLYTFVAALPAKTTRASCMFIGALPARDYAQAELLAELKRRIKGSHSLEWGRTTYEIQVDGVLLLPEPAADVAGLLFTDRGQPRAKEADRKRLTLNIGGGTTEVGGRIGMELIPGTEDGINLGFHDAAEIARQLLVAQHPRLQQVRVDDLIRAARSRSYQLTIGSEALNLKPFFAAGAEQIVPAILAALPPAWADHLPTSDLVVAGGAGEDFFTPLRSALSAQVASMDLIPNPVFSVLDGLVKFGRYKLAGRQ